MATTNGMLAAGSGGSGASAKQGSSGSQDDMMAQMMQGGMKRLEVAPDANTIPNYPQDAFMEGPMMNMDMMVDKPENYGLPAGWSENMQGMMTFVRVLVPAQYDEVMRRVAVARGTPPASSSAPAAASKSMHATAGRGAETPPPQSQAAPMNPAMKMDGMTMGGEVRR